MFENSVLRRIPGRKEVKSQEVEENSIIRSSITHTLRQV
jgi:hypothetical protein